MTKQFWVALIAVVVVLGGIFAITSNKADAPNSKNDSAQLTNHVEGDGKSGVKLVEFGDYQCPACGDYYQPLTQVVEKYKDQITFQFANFPLVSLHPNALAAARAAEAAGLQGKYWEMHDILYQQNVEYYTAQAQGTNINSWIPASDPLSFFTQYAQQLGLNVGQFKKDFKSARVNNMIQADEKEGNDKYKITGTPTFILDGKKIDNPAPTVDAFSKVLDKAISEKTGKPVNSTSTSPSNDANQPQPEQTKKQ